jgi:hypothetical protein
MKTARALPIGSPLANASFDSDTTRLLASAFETAWQTVDTLDGMLADESHRASTREFPAKRIIDMGQRDERNHDRLVENALAHLANSSGFDPIAGDVGYRDQEKMTNGFAPPPAE